MMTTQAARAVPADPRRPATRPGGPGRVAAWLLAPEKRPPWQERPRAATQGAKGGAIIVILLVIAIPLYAIVVTSRWLLAIAFSPVLSNAKQPGP